MKKQDIKLEKNVILKKNIGKTLFSYSSNLNPLTLLFNFILTIIFSFIIKIFYTRYSFSLTGKSHIASILPILSCVVFMIIVIIKSSIAISLGLVGALS